MFCWQLGEQTTMPDYDFRCKACGTRFTLFYKTYADYDRATPTCPQCGAGEPARVIGRVAFKAPTRDYTRMSSNEMLHVFESGDSRAVGEMFQQIGGADPALGAQYHEVTQRLLRGESMDSVERSLNASDSTASASPAPPAPSRKSAQK